MSVPFHAMSGPFPQPKAFSEVSVRCKSGPKDHINTRISDPGSKSQYGRDTRNHGLKDPYVYVGLLGPESWKPALEFDRRS